MNIGPLLWHKTSEVGGPAGRNNDGAPLFQNGDRLIIIVETTAGREMAIVDIDCDEDYFRATDASSGEPFDAWGPNAWTWWAKLDKSNLPPEEPNP